LVNSNSPQGPVTGAGFKVFNFTQPGLSQGSASIPGYVLQPHIQPVAIPEEELEEELELVLSDDCDSGWLEEEL
jgi:hypothetical protein